VTSGPVVNPTNGNKYYALDNSTWKKASDKAGTLGGHLVTLSNAAENAWVLANLQPAGNYWIGLNDITNEGNFVWSNGETVNYVNWAPTQPDNAGGLEDVVHVLDAGGKWNDLPPTATRKAIAEVEVFFCGDPDAGSCTSTHSNPFCNDTDCCNFVCAVDAFCCNISWDGICVDEAAFWCNPQVEAGPIINPHTGHVHTLLSPSAWQFARAEAVSQGSDPLTVNSGSENEWIRFNLGNAVPTVGNSDLWIGLNDATSEGNFVWSSGAPVSYTNWLPGQPNNFGNEDFVKLEASGGRWNDLFAFTSLRAVTEVSVRLCGTAGGSCFSTHGPGCDIESCCNLVCAVDSFCCNTSWDSTCVGEANAWCKPLALHGPFVNPASKHRYWVTQSASWTEAQKAAENLGGYLAVPNTAAENTWLKLNLLDPFRDVNSAFIGLTDQLIEGQFQTVTHEAIGFAFPWFPGEPNNQGNQDFVEMGASGQWNDLDTLEGRPALIEVPCVGDINNSGGVDASDLAILLGAWNAGGGSPSDLNHDGRVDAADLAVLLGGWGPCAASNCCFSHGGGSCDQPGCAACVCNLDPFCCVNTWDSICVGEAANQCVAACQCGQ